MSRNSTLTASKIRSYVREDCKEYSPEEIAHSIGSFVSDPPASLFQRTYLNELWTLLREKKGWKA